MNDNAPVILSNPVDRQKLKLALVEMTHCFQRMDDERESAKDIAADCEEQYGISKKLINKVAKTMYKHSYADVQAENEHFEFLYESIVDDSTKS